MESRVCGHCGQDFIKESFWERVAFIFGILFFGWLAYAGIESGGWGWAGGIFCILGAIGSIGIKFEEMKQKRGRIISPNRKCPSCGDRSVDPGSPLGRHTIRKWAAEDQKRALESVGGQLGLIDSSDSNDFANNVPPVPNTESAKEVAHAAVK